MQKSRCYFVAYGLLAVTVFLAIFVSCGKGTVDDPEKEPYLDQKDDVTDPNGNGYITRCHKDGEDSSNKPECQLLSSSSSDANPSSGDGTSSGNGEGESSSSGDEPPTPPPPESSSSSEELSSSSTGPSFILKCLGLAQNGPVGVPIPSPNVTCNGNPLSSVIFNWRATDNTNAAILGSGLTPPSQGMLFVFLKADCGGASQEINCGFIEIGTPSSSSKAASSSSAPPASLNCSLSGYIPAGVSIDPSSKVNCSGTSISAGDLTWSPATLTSSWFASPTVGTISNVKVTAKSGLCNGKTADCGDITVTSSNSGGGTSSASGGDCNRSGYCKYGDPECHEMPTTDCCKDGTFFTSKSACESASTQYCNWGRCENGSDWSCNPGGCYALSNSLTASDCTSKSGTIVNCCPTNTRPPSANYPACN